MSEDGTGEDWDGALDDVFDRSAAPESPPESARERVWDRVSDSIDAELEGDGEPDGGSGEDSDGSADDEPSRSERAAADSEGAKSGGVEESLAKSSLVRTAATFLVGAAVGAGGYAIYGAATSDADLATGPPDVSVVRDTGDAGSIDVARRDTASIRVHPDAEPDAETDSEAAGDGSDAEASPSRAAKPPADDRTGAADRREGGREEKSEPAGDGEDASGSLSAERSILSRAQSALGRRRADAALSALQEHERRFPNGELVEERRALTVRALHGSGRTDEAERRARSFLEDYPQSIFRDVVESVLRDIEHNVDAGP